MVKRIGVAVAALAIAPMAWALESAQARVQQDATSVYLQEPGT